MRTIILILILLNVSCSNDNQIKGVDLSSGWGHDVVLSYEITSQPVNGASLSINHNSAYRYQNLYLIVSQKGAKLDISDTLSIQLVDGQGYWMGNCLGERCNLLVPLELDPNIRELNVLQHSRDEILLDISSIDVLLN